MATFNTKQGPNRSLENYKEQHKDAAEKNGVFDQFMKAQTLTAARRILFGEKKKHINVGK